MEKIDVLWLVEHIAREMDVACAVKCLAESRYGLDITIRNMYLHANQVMREYVPEVVVHPFFYFVSGALATEDYVKTWPQATHFNLAWEEIHYKAHMKIKAPADEFAKKRVIHHAWGNFYKDYLLENSVPAEHIFVNGHPAYQLYQSPYNQYYRQRDWLADKYGLDNSARWIFVPENYRWAFIGRKINLFTRLGGDRDEILRMRDFSLDSLKQLLRWCNETARHEQIVLIFRPRPSTSSQLIKDFFEQNVGHASANLHFIKGESVREWILASDVVVSSYSTSLIEAAVADKPIYMAEPIPIPESLHCDWYRYVPRIHSIGEFEEACLKGSDGEDVDALKTWAQDEMLANGDPIERLADFVRHLVEEHKQVNTNPGFAMLRQSVKMRFRALFSSKERDYFNKATHEKDIFTNDEVQRRVDAWRKILVR
jgi:surface carbohydrate biosynthesis protein